MAIQDFGQSLLTRQRGRQKEVAKQQRKQQREVALGAIGGAIGNQFLKSRTEDFLNSETVRAEKIKFRNATKNAQTYLTTQQAIDQSGQSAADYFFEKNRGNFEQRAKAELEARGDYDLIGEAGAYNDVINKQVRLFADEMAEKHNQGLQFANSLGSEADLANIIALNVKEARPTNLLGAATQGVSNWLKGKSRAEIDQEAIEAIVDSPEMQNAEKLNLFMSEFNRTKNLVSAYDYADLIVPRSANLEMLVEDNPVITVSGNTVISYDKKVYKNRNTGKPRTDISELTVDYNKLKDPAEIEKETLEMLKSDFNWGKDTFAQLTSTGFKEFSNAMRDQGIDLTNVESVTDFTTLAKEYSEFLGNNPTYIKDSLRDTLSASAYDVLAGKAMEMQGLLAGLLNLDENVTQEMRDDARNKVATALGEVMILSQGLGQSVIDYNNL